MKWDVWKFIKNIFTEQTNYTLIFYYFIVYLFILLTIYPFLKNSTTINDTLYYYFYIIPGILLILMIYFASGINKLLTNTSTTFVGSFLIFETIVIFLILVWKVFFMNQSSFTKSFYSFWPQITFVLTLCGFLFTFVGLFWRCTFNNDPNEVIVAGCKKIFTIWWGWVIAISALWIVFCGYANYTQFPITYWLYSFALFAIIFLFILVILMNNNSVQTITPNSIMQTMWKYFCMILILFISSFLLLSNLNGNWNMFFSCVGFFLILVNLLPFIFQIPVATVQTYFFYPMIYLLVFGVTLGGLLFTLNNGGSELSKNICGILFAFIIFNIVMLVVNRNNLNDEKSQQTEQNEKEPSENLNDKENSKWFWSTFVVLTILLTVLMMKTKNLVLTPQVNTLAKLGGGAFTILFLFILYHLFRISALINFDSSNENTLYKVWSYVKELFGVVVIILIFYGLKQLDSPIVNLITLLLLIYLFSKFYRLLNDVLLQHESKTNCSLTTKGWFARFISPIVFFICGLLFIVIVFFLNSTLTFTKNSNPFLNILGLTEIYRGASFDDISTRIILGVGLLFTIIFTIFGYYVGSIIGDKKNSTENQQDKYCKEFKKVTPLTMIDGIKLIFYFSIIVLLFIFMNAYIDKIYKTSWDSFQNIFIGLLFFVLIQFSITIFNAIVHLTQLFSIIFKTNYYSSYTNKLNDFLIFLFSMLIIFSNIGLIYRIFQTKKKTLSRQSLIRSSYKDPYKNLYGINRYDPYRTYGVNRYDPYRTYGINRYDPRNTYRRGGNFGNGIKPRIGNSVLTGIVGNKVVNAVNNDESDISNVIFFIPRKLNEFYLHSGEYLEKNLFKSILIIVSLETGLIGLYILISFIKSKLTNNQSTFKLITIPTPLFPSISISDNYFFNPENSTTIFARGIPTTQTYTFGLSFSLFIEEAGSDNSFINILSFNENPSVKYKPTSNNLIVTIPTSEESTTKSKISDTDKKIIDSYTVLNTHIGSIIEKKVIIYSTTDIKIQKWINIFINYNHGTINTFMNGDLVNTTNSEIYRGEYENGITIGYNEENDSIIKIKNLNFYNKDIGADEILYINTF
uniref:Uncharacterized protein n=1 Tax=viral metagenome TaxID=1070528 RepID=A0A6C0HSQ6_9ZZZZ